MEKVKSKLFKSIESNGVKDFVKLASPKSGEINIGEFLTWLPSKHHEELFNSLLIMKLVPLIEEELLVPSSDNQDIDINTAKSILIDSLRCFDSIIHICHCYLKIKDYTSPPDQLFQMLSIFHNLLLPMLNLQMKIESTQIFSEDVLLRLSKMYGKIASEIATICELWYKQDRPSKEELVPQTIGYLVQKAFESTVVSDIVRLYNMKSGLALLDFGDESSDSLKELLLGCFMIPHFHKSNEGKKMLTFLFSIKPQFIDLIHAVVKGQLVECSRSTLEDYAEIYYKAWRSATGPFLMRIEFGCLQNLATCAIHASNPKLFKCLMPFLHYFHEKKAVDRTVDAMLLRVYEPILWRSLSVANAGVRTNATRLFIDCFPLYDSESSTRESDELLQKQFVELQKLLYDPAITVRQAAVHGTLCVILPKFWEIIPIGTTKILLTKIIYDLGRDKSSGLIRETVFEGLKYLLQNQALSHGMVALLLPHLSNLIHDSSERVRSAFLDLLLYIKELSTIRFLDIVPLEHILERMVIDHSNTSLSKKLTQLLVEAYFPEGEQSSVMMNRCVMLVKSKRDATIGFYSNLVGFVELRSIARFLVFTFKFIIAFINQNPDSSIVSTSESTNNENDNDNTSGNNNEKKKKKVRRTKKEIEREKKMKERETLIKKQQKEEKDRQKEEGEEESQDDIPITLDDIECLLEIVNNTISSIQPLLFNTENRYILNGLLAKFTDENLTVLYFWLFGAKTPRINSMCLTINISSIFGIYNYPLLSSILLKNLNEIDQTTPDRLKETLVTGLFQHHSEEVLTIIFENITRPISLLSESTENSNPDKEVKKNKNTSSKRKRIEDGDQAEDDDEEEEEDEDQNLNEVEESLEEKLEGASELAIVSISFLDILLKKQDTRIGALSHSEVLSQLIQNLMTYMPIIQQRLILLAGGSSNGNTDISSQTSSISDINTDGISDKLLLSVFVIYCKILFHAEGLQDQLQADSGLFSTLFGWGGEVLLPCVKSFVSHITRQSGKRKHTDEDEQEEEEEMDEYDIQLETERFNSYSQLPLDITRSYLLFVTENITLGLTGRSTMRTLCEQMEMVLDFVTQCRMMNPLLPIVAKYIYQLYYSTNHNHLLIAAENSNEQEDVADDQMIHLDQCNRLLGRILDSTASSVKVVRRSERPIQLFKLTDLMHLHYQRETLGPFTKQLMDRVLPEIKSIGTNICPKTIQTLEVLSPLSNFIISQLVRSTNFVSVLADQLSSYLKGERMSKISIYNSLNIISIVIKTCINFSKTTEYSSLQNLLISFISQLPHLSSAEEEDNEDEWIGDPEQIFYSSLLEISKKLLNESMKKSKSISA